MLLTPGTRVGPYQIVAPLGAGGMGEVYLASDSRLGREVAIKVLSHHLADHPEVRARFEREAKTVSALNHPHICTVHDVGMHEGRPYLVMERLSGRSLSEVIGRQPMPIDRVLALGEQIADALDVAHRAGIIHRDLKPANLFVTDRGDAKVLDFGLAKTGTKGLGESSDPASEDAPTLAAGFQTEIGSTLGTVAYMSPEQARTEPLDARSDLFSLGVVLYEMATGRMPFEGKSKAEFFAAILKSEPTPPGELNPRVPEPLEAIILKSLEKDPARRYQSAAELRGDLHLLRSDTSGLSSASSRSGSGRFRASSASTMDAGPPGRGLRLGVTVAVIVAAVGIGYFASRGNHSKRDAGSATGGGGIATPVAAEAPEHSIAVLPFLDLSPGKDQEYFSDGISEELLNLLAKVPQLQVIARTSSFSFKGKEVGIPEIARRLHVRHVLEGSVRKVGNKVRITAQLIDADTDSHLWSETYDRTLNDVFAIQDEIAADVVKQLQVRLLGPAPKVRATDPVAYALYLESVQLTRQRSAAAFARSDSLLARVLATDSLYAPAWATLARNLVNEVTIGILQGEAAYPRARAAAEKALAIDPQYARAYVSLGSIDIFEGNVAAAAEHFGRALAIDPIDLTVLGNSSAVLKSLGRLDEAIALDEAVVARDPVNTSFVFNLASAQNWDRRYEAAIASMRVVLDLTPGFSGAHLVLGESLLGMGDAAGALAAIQQEPTEPFRMIGLPMAYHALRRRAASDSALAALIAKYGKDAPYDIAYVYAYRGDRDRAFEWLEKSAALHDPSLVLLLVENLFTNLHSDPRWLPFLRKLGKAPEQLAKISFQLPPGVGQPVP